MISFVYFFFKADSKMTKMHRGQQFQFSSLFQVSSVKRVLKKIKCAGNVSRFFKLFKQTKNLSDSLQNVNNLIDDLKYLMIDLHCNIKSSEVLTYYLGNHNLICEFFKIQQ